MSVPDDTAGPSPRTAREDFDDVARLPARRAGGGLLHLGPPASRPNVPALLLVHGAFHGAWCYGGWMRSFASRGLASAAVDVRGHGALRDEGLAVESGVADYAADVCDAARVFDARPVLVGHSLGGLVAMLAATTLDPSGLVLVAPSPPGNLPGAQGLPLVPVDALRPPPPLAEVSARFLGGDPAVDLDDYAARLGPESPGALNDRYGLAIAIDAARIRCPVLVVEAGRDDALRHPGGQDESIAHFFGGRHICVEDAPHCMMVGRSADATASLVAAWVTQLGR